MFPGVAAEGAAEEKGRPHMCWYQVGAAAARRLFSRALAGGVEDSRRIAEQQPEDRVANAQGKYTYGAPQDEGRAVRQDLLSEGRYELVGNQDDRSSRFGADG